MKFKMSPSTLSSMEGFFGPSFPDIKDIYKYIASMAKNGNFDLVQIYLWQPLAWCAGMFPAGFKADEDKGVKIENTPSGLFLACWQFMLNYRVYDLRTKWNVCYFQYDATTGKMGIDFVYDQECDGLPRSSSSASHSKPDAPLIDDKGTYGKSFVPLRNNSMHPNWLP